MDNYADILQEWHPRNQQKPIDSKTGDRDPVWWRCPVGHSYKERLTYRLHQDKHCPVCREEIHLAEDQASIADVCPELRGYQAKYGFCAEDLLASANSILFCPQNHPFVFWGAHPEEIQGCPRCLFQEDIDILTEELAPGETFPSPIEYPGSLSEEKMRRLLKEEGLQLLPPNTAIRLAERFFNWMFAVPDIIIDGTKIAVEYDDISTHAGRAEKDSLKGELLRQVGWKLIRVRTGGLQKITADDIQTGSGPTKYAAKEIAEQATT